MKSMLASSFLTLVVIFLALPQLAAAQGFNEQFNSPTLDPAWTVVPGVRIATGFPPPANDYSLSANPGHLRYSLNPMTHQDGFLNNYQPTFGFHSCCTHDPSLELHRSFGGENWLFEARARYFLPFTNGRSFDVRIYFGNGGPGTVWVAFWRGRDVHPVNYIRVRLIVKTGPALGDQMVLEDTNDLNHFCGYAGCDFTQMYWRLERAGSVLTAMWSDDGAIWNTAWSHDLGTALDGLDQRVVITGGSWFNSAGSYADYDYITVTPTVVPVAIDIKPGSFPNSINPKSNGVIPVAILTTDTFDATTVAPATVRFGRTGAEAAPAHSALEDVDGDGDTDMILHFNTQDTGIRCGDTTASLTGNTFSGQAIKGTDSIKTVGCK